MSDAQKSLTTATEEPKMIAQDYSSSGSIAELAKALAAAQLEMTGAVKDSQNPFFKSNYADLASVLDAIKACNKHGIAIIQMPFAAGGGLVGLTTLMAHSSGEWLSASFTMRPTKDDPQGCGSCLTYMRRYAASAFTGVAQVDDDGNDASKKAPTEQPVKYISEEQAADIEAMISEVNADKQKMLAHFRAASVHKIPAGSYKAVVNALEAKRLKAAVKTPAKEPDQKENINTGWGGLSAEEQEDIPQ